MAIRLPEIASDVKRASKLLSLYNDSFQLLVDLLFLDAPVCAVDASYYRCMYLNDELRIAGIIDVDEWIKNSNDCMHLRDELRKENK